MSTHVYDQTPGTVVSLPEQASKPKTGAAGNNPGSDNPFANAWFMKESSNSPETPDTVPLSIEKIQAAAELGRLKQQKTDRELWDSLRPSYMSPYRATSPTEEELKPLTGTDSTEPVAARTQWFHETAPPKRKFFRRRLGATALCVALGLGGAGFGFVLAKSAREPVDIRAVGSTLDTPSSTSGTYENTLEENTPETEGQMTITATDPAALQPASSVTEVVIQLDKWTGTVDPTTELQKGTVEHAVAVECTEQTGKKAKPSTVTRLARSVMASLKRTGAVIDENQMTPGLYATGLSSDSFIAACRNGR